MASNSSTLERQLMDKCQANVAELMSTSQKKQLTATSNSSDEVRLDHESKTDLCAQCMCNSKEILAVFYCLDCDDKFCEDCGNWHRTSKLSKDHRLSTIEDAPPSDVAQMIQKLAICPNHPSEKVVYFCVEEDTMCCNQCAITSHRQCSYLYTIEECVQQHYAPEKLPPPTSQFSHYHKRYDPVYITVKAQIKKEELNDCSQRISDGLIALENEMVALITHEASIQDAVTRSPDQVKALLQDVHAKIESAFSTLERQMMDQCQEKVAELMSTSQEKQVTVRALESQIKNYQENLRKMKEHGKDHHMFILCHDMNTILKAVQEDAKKLVENKSMSVVGVEQTSSTDEIVKSILNAIQITLTGFDMTKQTDK